MSAALSEGDRSIEQLLGHSRAIFPMNILAYPATHPAAEKASANIFSTPPARQVAISAGNTPDQYETKITSDLMIYNIYVA
ncbi:hypothetical protein J8J21_21100, partial [Mycobacterium tuberculosis]